MRPVVGTLAFATDAVRLGVELRRTFGLALAAVRTATVAAYGEPHDGHALIAAWVADEDEAEAKEMLGAAGATVHEEPFTIPGP